MRTVTVKTVSIPAWSTIGFASGEDEDGNHVTFAGDHRPMLDIGQAVASAETEEELPVVEVAEWQLV